MNEWIVLYVLTAHFIADFVFQKTKTGLLKSKDNVILLSHVITYVVILAILMVPVLGLHGWGQGAGLYALVNGVLHFPTDFISSRLSSKYYKEGRLYAFWKVIGLDQLAHYAGLFLTLPYFLPQ